MSKVYLFSVEGSQEIEGEDVQWEFNVRLIYAPGKLSGPPEDCYPDESEVEILTGSTYPGGYEEKIDEDKVIQAAWDKWQQIRSER